MNAVRLTLIALASLAASLGAALAASPTGAHDDKKERVRSTDEFVSRDGQGIDPDSHPGNALYAENCGTCHNGRVPKAPATVWLEMMAPDALLAAMTDGIMKQQAAHLGTEQKTQIAEYLTRTSLADYTPPPPPEKCDADRAGFDGPPPARVGWGHDTRRFVPQEVAGLAGEDLKSLELKWAFAYPAAVRARSQPAIGWNTIFVGSQDGTVYAFDLETGCTKWTQRVSAEVRTGIIVDAATERLYFGDFLGRAYAADAKTGEILWRTKVDDHPNATITGTPTLGDDFLYVPVSSLEVTSAADPTYACCTFRGALAALNPETGAVVWKTHTIPEEPSAFGETSIGTKIFGPSGAPVWTAPTYDAKRGRVYFGSGENYSSPADGNSDAVFAIDAKTGEKIWRRQLTANDAWNVGCMMDNENCPEEDGPDVDLSAAPLIVPTSEEEDILVVGQKSGVAYGIDIDTGDLLWNRRLGHGGTQGGVHFGMAADGARVYVPINDMKDTRDARVYNAAQYGAGVHAIDARSGDVLWRNVADDVCAGREYCDPGVSAAVTAVPGALIAGHLDGRLRAYDAESGAVLWSFDTTQPIATISGETASGGSMSGPGPAVANGYLVANSGYGLYYHMPGNVLLVFGRDDIE
ncbi:MAG: PQQ-binding-like beta-propeller repeat protein [Pseudomonadota bacterium]